MASALGIVIIIMSIVILAFAITDIVYVVRVRNGYVMTTTDTTALIAINVILAVISIIILICAVVGMSRGSNDVDQQINYQQKAAEITKQQIEDACKRQAMQQQQQQQQPQMPAYYSQVPFRPV